MSQPEAIPPAEGTKSEPTLADRLGIVDGQFWVKRSDGSHDYGNWRAVDFDGIGRDPQSLLQGNGLVVVEQIKPDPGHEHPARKYIHPADLLAMQQEQKAKREAPANQTASVSEPAPAVTSIPEGDKDIMQPMRLIRKIAHAAISGTTTDAPRELTAEKSALEQPAADDTNSPAGGEVSRTEAAADTFDAGRVFASAEAFNEALTASPFGGELSKLQNIWINIRNAEQGNRLWEEHDMQGAMRDVAPFLPELSALSDSFAALLKRAGDNLWEDAHNALVRGRRRSAEDALDDAKSQLQSAAAVLAAMNTRSLHAVEQRFASVAGIQEAHALAAGPESHQLNEAEQESFVTECRKLSEQGNDINSIMAAMKGRLADSTPTWESRQGAIDLMYAVTHGARSSAIEAAYGQLYRAFHEATEWGQITPSQLREVAESHVAGLLNQARHLHGAADRAQKSLEDQD